MLPNLKEFEAKALKLSLTDRALLAEHLIKSLDTVDDAENERLWVKEAERRYHEYKKGNISARSADDVLQDARLKIK